MLLADRVLVAAASATELPIDIVVSADLGGSTDLNGEQVETFPSATFRFYVRRADDPWLSEDLEGFREAVAVIRAS